MQQQEAPGTIVTAWLSQDAPCHYKAQLPLLTTSSSTLRRGAEGDSGEAVKLSAAWRCSSCLRGGDSQRHGLSDGCSACRCRCCCCCWSCCKLGLQGGCVLRPRGQDELRCGMGCSAASSRSPRMSCMLWVMNVPMDCKMLPACMDNWHVRT